MPASVPTEPTLTELARTGFTSLDSSAERVGELARASGVATGLLLDAFAIAADPDDAVIAVLQLHERAPDAVSALLADGQAAARFVRVLGASRGLADFFLRHPDQLDVFAEPVVAIPDPDDVRSDLLAVVDGRGTGGPDQAETAWSALRVQYRRRLAELAIFDLTSVDPVAIVDLVAASLAELAGAALDAALDLARQAVSLPEGERAFGRFPAHEVEATRLAIIGMGKAGASELNYVSDVDVIFVADVADGSDLGADRAIEIATRLAMLTMKAISASSVEPDLWEVDPNLRPEGKDGALVRTLDSHVQYYDRWAKSWEFQALLKARPLAGDRALGARYVEAVAPKVWSSASRENFVESVQRMRERVTAHIPDDEIDIQVKLGPGGLRDIEFTVQLLQLVHGRTDASVHQAGTLPALAALADAGYVGRVEAAEFAHDYRVLRLLEHRLQLERLRRTHLMPRGDAELRVIGRASGLAPNATQLREVWQSTRQRVRGLHERLFYRPLLSAVAALPSSGLSLTSEQAEDRLAAIGFRDPRGALAHIGALTAGVSRRATIQRHLLPVMLGWFAEGADPDYGLLAFRRLSDKLGTTHWYLRLLRDSSEAGHRLTRILAGSRYAGELLERTPESVAWLEDDDDLRPRTLAVLSEETKAVVARHGTAEAAAKVLRTARRREVLRLAFAAILERITVEQLGQALSDVTENLVRGLVDAIRAEGAGEFADDGIEFAVIGMGRFGGAELGFGSDADVMYVFRPGRLEGEAAQQRAQKIVSELIRLGSDAHLPLDLDADLRPEGRNGVLARSLDAYRSYYERWSLTWEAQALLRARGVAGDSALIRDFEALADTVRYPAEIDESAVREVKRIKARVENERLPQGADPTRHLKLGRGSLSDVEWFVQLLQLEHASSVPALRTTSTLAALAEAVEAQLITPDDAALLRAAWVFASRARSALTLWLNKTTDVLPVDRIQLEGVARLLEYPPGSASMLEQDYLQITRRSRAVFERGFYGTVERHEPSI
ncbi:bifunctional [glutamine synthetase] adenylyltransferase/[glutamine synthetase]-adenylyl-L-tyrosine phosphorylase [Agromyces atrinae]|uniref:Bifunctional [glutamine synthetase] adenylyltransferase/[glutamine synthetase]-adenylyl-L-tyrosine phosphorylase n=1 Tax=Agromyces atrinae TaxID=592376 RepID=A0A4Q2M7W1_9MICO|nr:bifunctional [glutamine synthetase] adenylyltransferase/[glutamine synthetase]-adenylyl-L-tyrosine phosphorylase [Agromyces atrinae]RXZ86403.1 bifunctional [glutamine synthetase] adenylyltransferase/[glutamine synthetase]-adenylyl-L-tyrosine phosphorylase [Agromyces atrinae]